MSLSSVLLQLCFATYVPRLYILRVLLIADVVAMATFIYLAKFHYVPMWMLGGHVLIFLHHASSIVSWKLLFIPLDALLTILEASGLFIWLTVGGLWIADELDSISLSFAFYASSSCLIAACLVAMTLQRLSTLGNIVTRKEWRRLTHSYDILVDQAALGDPDHYSIWQRLIGKNVYGGYYVGEMMAIRVLRGVLGACFMTAIVLYCVVVVVVQPAQENGRVLITEYRYTKSDKEIRSSVERYGVPTWNIIAALPSYLEPWSLDSSYPSLQDIVNAINASVLDDGAGTVSSGNTCNIVHSSFARLKISDIPAIQCSDQSLISSGGALLPNLLLTLNFTKIRSGNKAFSQLSLPVINIIPGMTNQLDVGVQNVVNGASAIALTPGVNLIASLRPDIDTAFVHGGSILRALVLKDERTFWTPTAASIYPNPSLSINPSPDISTLLLFVQDDIAPSKVALYSSVNPIINGFSSVGGMLSIISGGFAIVFGGSLIRLLTGPQKLSLGGIIHKLQIQKTKKACLDRYPNILEEVHGKENQGLLALIRDHYVDVHFLMGENVEHDQEKNGVRPHQTTPQFSVPGLNSSSYDLPPNTRLRSI